MSTVETIKAAVGSVEIAGPTVAEQLQASIPHRAASNEIALRTMAVYLPEEPINIKGEPYMLTYNELRLTEAINTVAEYGSNAHFLYPRQLVVDLEPRKRDLRLDEDSLPELSRKDAQNPRLYLMPKEKGSAIHLTLPREVESPELTVDGVVKLVTRSINQDLFAGLEENIQAKRTYNAGRRISSIVLGMGAGEGVGIALADKNVTMLEYGSAGALGGAIAVACAVLAGDYIRSHRVGGGGVNDSSYARWAIVRGRDKVKSNRLGEALKDDYGKGPIISLEAVGQEEVTSSISP